MVVATAVGSGCAVNAAAPDTSTDETVGFVGVLPIATIDTTPQITESPVDSAVTVDATAASASIADGATSTSAVDVPVEAEPLIGARVFGNKLLIIGDSLTASISRRYGGEACRALVPLGWQVEVDAETGRFIDFGARVLDKRLSAGWDAAVLFLGNNYGEDRGVYQLGLHSLLLRLYPRPTVVITTALFRPEQAEVNEVILEEAAAFDNVSVIDWATLGSDPSLTGSDGLHLTDQGRERLAAEIAAVTGPSPVAEGKCLSTSFSNDSAGSPSGPAGNNTVTKPSKPTATTAPRPSGTPTTTRPTATTAKPTASSTPGGATPPSTAQTTPASTSPPTVPASTAPASTAPASTAPAPTVPQSTAPVTSPPLP